MSLWVTLGTRFWEVGYPYGEGRYACPWCGSVVLNQETQTIYNHSCAAVNEIRRMEEALEDADSEIEFAEDELERWISIASYRQTMYDSLRDVLSEERKRSESMKVKIEELSRALLLEQLSQESSNGRPG